MSSSRLRRWARAIVGRRPSVSLGIVAVSIVGTVAGYQSVTATDQAATAANDAFASTARLQGASVVAGARAGEDARLAVLAAEDENTALLLAAQAKALRGGAPALAAELGKLADTHRTRAKQLPTYMNAPAAATRSPGGVPTFDLKLAVDLLLGESVTERAADLEAQTAERKRRAGQLRDRATELQLAAMVFVVALFCLTLAELFGRLPGRGFAAAGAAAAAAGTSFFVLAFT